MSRAKRVNLFDAALGDIRMIMCPDTKLDLYQIDGEYYITDFLGLPGPHKRINKVAIIHRDKILQSIKKSAQIIIPYLEQIWPGFESDFNKKFHINKPANIINSATQMDLFALIRSKDENIEALEEELRELHEINHDTKEELEMLKVEYEDLDTKHDELKEKYKNVVELSNKIFRFVKNSRKEPTATQAKLIEAYENVTDEIIPTDEITAEEKKEMREEARAAKDQLLKPKSQVVKSTTYYLLQSVAHEDEYYEWKIVNDVPKNIECCGNFYQTFKEFSNECRETPLVHEYAFLYYGVIQANESAVNTLIAVFKSIPRITEEWLNDLLTKLHISYEY